MENEKKISPTVEGLKIIGRITLDAYKNDPEVRKVFKKLVIIGAVGGFIQGTLIGLARGLGEGE